MECAGQRSDLGRRDLQVTGTNGSVEIEPFAPHVGGTDAAGEVYLAIGATSTRSLVATFLDAVRRVRPGGGRYGADRRTAAGRRGWPPHAADRRRRPPVRGVQGQAVDL